MSDTHDISIDPDDHDPSDDDRNTAAGLLAAGGVAATAAGTVLLDDEAEAAAVEAKAEQDEEDEERRAVYAGWAFLSVLFAIFLAIALWAFNAEDGDSDVEPAATATTDVAAALTSVDLTFVVDGDTVTLTGSVPDEEARAQLVEFASARYSTVNDELTIDDGTTLAGGIVNVSGSADEGDDDPAGLQADAAVLGLDAGALDVTFNVVELAAVDAEVAVATNAVMLSGSFPDQASLDQFVAAANSVFGAENVDGSGLTVDPETTLAGSRIRITGLIDAGDTRGDALQTELATFFGGTTIDQSGLTFDTGADALTRLEERLKADLAATPILFNSASFDVDDFDENNDILTRAAAAINAAPGIPVEVVGHTDSSGNAGANQLLSLDRANAVLDRLVELGVDAERLTARGAGSAEPVADNDTEDGRAANRRIVFEFEGAADADTTDEAETDTTDEADAEG